MKRCRLLGNDTGLLHIASAFHIPIVQLSCHPRFGSMGSANSPLRFGPRSIRHVVIQPQAARSGCQDIREALEPHCIAGISVEEFKRAIKELFIKRESVIADSKVRSEIYP